MIDPDLARELSRAAKQSESFRARRDELIVRAAREGAGLRELGRLVGLTHPSVIAIIRRHEAGEDAH